MLELSPVAKKVCQPTIRKRKDSNYRDQLLSRNSISLVGGRRGRGENEGSCNGGGDTLSREETGLQGQTVSGSGLPQIFPWCGTDRGWGFRVGNDGRESGCTVQLFSFRSLKMKCFTPCFLHTLYLRNLTYPQANPVREIFKSCLESFARHPVKRINGGSSLVAQWQRTCLPMKSHRFDPCQTTEISFFPETVFLWWKREEEREWMRAPAVDVGTQCPEKGQGTSVTDWQWFRIREDPTCLGATKAMCHNYGAWELQLTEPTGSRAHAQQQEKTPRWETHVPQLESSPCSNRHPSAP